MKSNKLIKIVFCCLFLCLSSFPLGNLKINAEQKTTNSTGYFYDQLSNDQKVAYDAIASTAFDADGIINGTAEVTFSYSGIEKADILTFKSSLNLSDVSYAITRDHPEFFWLNFNNLGYQEVSYDEASKTLTLSTTPPSGGTYYWKGLTDEQQVRKMNDALNKKLDEIVALVNTPDRYTTVKNINQWIVDNNKYNTVAAGNRQYELAWSAVSGILSDNDPSIGPVCYGYTMAFKLICDRLNIPCIEVEGSAYTSDSAAPEGHAWNYVQMEDNRWYAIDSTWNDASTNIERFFLIGKNTVTQTGEKDTFAENHVVTSKKAPTLADDAFVSSNVAYVGNTTYPSIQEAINNANGQPVNLLQDVSISQPLNISGTVTINFRGRRIDNATATNVASLIIISNGASLTLTNDRIIDASAFYANGLLYQTNGVSGNVIDNQGTLILDSVMMTSKNKTGLLSGNSYTLSNHGFLISSGSDFLNVNAVKSYTLSPTALMFGPIHFNGNSTSDLAAYLNNNKPTIAYTTADTRNIANAMNPTWTTNTTTLTYGQTYTFNATAYGHNMSIDVTYANPKTTPLSGSVSISGKPNVKKVVSADISAITLPTLGAISYTWLLDDIAIPSANASTYTIQSSDLGKTLKVEVSAENYTGTLTSNGVVVLAEESSHTHSFESAWSFNENDHWHAATCEHTNEVSNKSTHTWDSGVITTPATHTSDGVKTFTCTICPATKMETIPMDVDAHTFETTYSSNDTHHWFASTCGHGNEISNYAPHSWDHGVITTPPTHTTTGVKTFTCTGCAKTRIETIPMDVNAHTFETTYSSNDTHHWFASTCGHSNEISNYAPHSWDHGVITTPPTHTTTGVKTFTCTGCAKTRIETIPMDVDAHTFETNYSHNENNHWYAATCEHTNETKDLAIHIASDWIVATQPTSEAEGSKYIECSICKRIMQTMSIPKIPYSYAIISGDNSTWNQNKTDLSIRIDADYNSFQAIKINGKEIDKHLYSVKHGSTIITLKQAYLATLKPGKYNLSVIFENKEVTTHFEIMQTYNETTKSPQTSDTTNVSYFLHLLAGATLILVGYGLHHKSRINK